MPNPNLDPEKPSPPKKEPSSRRLDVVPALRLDTAAILQAAESEVDAFLAECDETEKPRPVRQEVLDRIAALAGNIDPMAPDGVNSLAKNRRFVIHHRPVPPYFAVGTEE